MDTVREFLDGVEETLSAAVPADRKQQSIERLKQDALGKYMIFLTQESLQFIERSSTPPVKAWVVSVVGRQQMLPQNQHSLGNTLLLFYSLLKTAIQDLPASLGVAQKIIICTTRLLPLSFRAIFLTQAEPDEGIWHLQSNLNQQIVRLTDSPSMTLRNHALKFMERLVLSFSYAEKAPVEGEFSLDQLRQALPPSGPFGEVPGLGRKLLEHMTGTLLKLAINTKADPPNAAIPNQVVIIQSLCLIREKRPRNFGRNVIGALCEATARAHLSWSESSLSRTLFYTLRHALIAIMESNTWDNDDGEQLLTALTRLDARERGEILFKRFRPLELRNMKRRHAELSQPPAKRSRHEAPSREMAIADLVLQTLDRMPPPAQYQPLARPQTVDPERMLQEVEPMYHLLTQMPASDSSVDRASDPRRPSASTKVPPPTTTPKFSHPPACIPLKPDMALLMSDKAVERILAQESGARRAGQDWLRMRLISRLVCLQKDLTHPLSQAVIKFLVEQLSERVDLAVQWLYQEYFHCLQEHSAGNTDPDVFEKARIKCLTDSRYTQLLQTIVERMCVAFQPSKESDPLFRSFILRVPDLSAYVMSVLRQYCEAQEPERISLGLTCYRDIAMLRPALRDGSLQTLVQYATVPEQDKTREQATEVIIGELCEDSSLLEDVKELAQDLFSSLKLAKEVEVSVEENEGNAEDQDEEYDTMEEEEAAVVDNEALPPAPPEQVPTTELFPLKSLPEETLNQKQVRQKFQLFLRLCHLDHALVPQMVEIYGQCIEGVQAVIRKECSEFFKSIPQSDPIVVPLLRAIPQGGETLVLHLLRQQVSDAIEPALGSLIQELYKEGVLDARFLTFVLRTLDKETVLQYLPALISVPSDKDAASALYTILSTPPNERTLSPTELLVQLHNLESLDTKAQHRAIRICLKAPNIQQETMAVVLRQLVDKVPLSRFFFVTMIDSYKLHTRLGSFILDLLRNLITKSVWKSPESWKGFIKCCEALHSLSFPILVQLPPTHLRDFLSNCDTKYREDFVKSCQQLENISKQLLPIIEPYYSQ